MRAPARHATDERLRAEVVVKPITHVQFLPLAVIVRAGRPLRCHSDLGKYFFVPLARTQNRPPRLPIQMSPEPHGQCAA